MQALWLLVTEWIGYQIIKSIVAPLSTEPVFANSDWTRKLQVG